MNAITRRIATGFAVAAAPAIIAMGAATTCHAQATAVNTHGPTSSQAAASHASQTGVSGLTHRHHHHHGYYHRR